MWQFVFDRAMIMLAQVSGAPAAPNSVSAPSAAAGGHNFGFFHILFLFVYFLVCVGLVAAVLLQTTKSEGLSGVLGGGTQSVFRGKKGIEERLAEATNYLAVSFIVLSLLLSVFAFR